MTKDDLLDIHQVADILPVNVRQLYGWHERNYAGVLADLARSCIKGAAI